MVWLHISTKNEYYAKSEFYFLYKVIYIPQKFLNKAKKPQPPSLKAIILQKGETGSPATNYYQAAVLTAITHWWDQNVTNDACTLEQYNVLFYLRLDIIGENIRCNITVTQRYGIKLVKINSCHFPINVISESS